MKRRAAVGWCDEKIEEKVLLDAEENCVINSPAIRFFLVRGEKEKGK